MGTEPATDLAAGTVVGRYEIQSPLGSGGMGAVYLARDLKLQRPVALKLLSSRVGGDSSLQARFRREAQIVIALNHPHVLTVYDAGEADGTLYMATELVEGATLRQRMAERPLPIPELLRIGAQVASALAAAHAAGIVHRDVKPENVMLRTDGYVKVLDFGVAKLLADSPARVAEELRVTREDTMVGTVAYMSPEQLRGAAVDGRSDLWSLGVLLYEVATDELPFTGRTVSGVITSILSAPLSRPSTVAPGRVPPALDAILERALARDPQERYRSGTELAADLERLRIAIATGNDPAQRAQSTEVMSSHGESGPWLEIAQVLRAAPAAAPAPRHNLPAAATSFHGREEQLAAVLAALRDPAVRLLVLLGPGGAGKTRLATEAGRALLEDFADGVWLVPLAATTDPDALPSAIADALALKDLGDRPDLSGLSAWLRSRHTLLVLDNLEQVVGVARPLAHLLAAAPHLRLLVTSREVLRLRGEWDLVLPPLELPDARQAHTAEEIAASPAVALFVSRARAVDAGFRLDERNAEAVAELCRRLDGLPLAIELAAARVRVLPPQTMLQRLDDRFRVLATGAADLPDRHRTLRATLDWGYDLLAPAERIALRRVGVFRGSFSASAAAAVCFGDGADELDVLERLESLVDKSLLQLRPAASPDSQPRFAMLESIRDYARARQESAERDDLRRRHASYFLDLAERGIPELAPATHDVPLAELAAAEEDLREALAWAFEQEDPEPALRLTGSLWWYWYMRGEYREGRQWADRAVARSTDVRTPARARALLGAGRLAYLQCDYSAGEALLEASGALSRELGEQRTLAATLQFSASIARERGDYERSSALHHESLALWRALGDQHGVARSCNYVAFVRWLQGDLDAADAPAREAHARFEALDDREGLAWALLNGAAIAYYRRQLAAARQEAREALALASEAGYQEGIAWALNLLGNVALREHRAEQARALLRRSLELHRDLGDRWRMCSVLESLAAVFRADGDTVRAARLDAGAAALRETLSTPQPPAECRDWEDERAAAASAIGAQRMRILVSEGSRMRPEQLVAEAL